MVYIVSDSVVSPLGFNTPDNFAALLRGQSGVRQQRRGDWSETPFPASMIGDQTLSDKFLAGGFGDGHWTRFEKMLLLSVSDALSQAAVGADDPDTVFIFSTTKGNIALLENGNPANPALLLSNPARKVAAFFKNPNTPLVVSHACVSGVAALLLGKRLLESGRYRHAVVAGADEVTRFVWSGFQSFQALSDEPCRPFDSRRKGLNLGEGAAAMVLSIQPERAAGRMLVRILGGALSNDANHISGPSRTGAELSEAVNRALGQSGLHAADIGFISAHGTATPYNDEMEAKAFDLSGLNNTPLNSLKGHYGHTLGAAGLIETALSAQSLRENTVLPTKGFESLGVSRPVNVCAEPMYHSLEVCLKTASGFGGCNGALVLGKG